MSKPIPTDASRSSRDTVISQPGATGAQPVAQVVVFRALEHEDIEGLAALVADAFAGYRVFAPPGWQPPSAGEQIRVLERWINDPDFWGELASDGHALVGHATVIPAARHSFRAAPEPGLAHLGHLFVKPRYWGSGVAARLMAHAMTAASKGGFTAMRLFVPVGQARARSFYARERFVAVSDPFDPGHGLPVLEYRRSFDL